MPSQCSPRSYRGWVWSFPRGPPPLICVSGVTRRQSSISGSGPSTATAGSRSSRARPQGRVSPRGPLAEPRQASPPSPPAISPGFASPGDLRPIPDPGEARQRLPTASLHRA
ncbi:hypothetical protein NDU88_000777 [Pleurodeles waltl]|uniref:Uncharacterized protein n=1 Tax=Pleurodeles waltl TaxID=8319 RepID=A0AAV7LAV2_PLEWA|nr:hypothetical protein NDU88_000777 [Pleurodeles waltl]